uniref:Ig-like domain-containing protein n=1 Tax=Globodera rostochiensis TaxID=31243 RepID=A0A914GXA1_GLORO
MNFHKQSPFISHNRNPSTAFFQFPHAFCRPTILPLPLLLLLWLLLTDRSSVCLRANRSPKILDGSMHNVTAMRDDTVEFRCRVENGAKSKVAFFRDELPPKLIAYDESVFRRSDKYELLARVNGGSDWILRIREVQEDDAGVYICQLNTNPVLSRKGLLELRIPPAISRSSTPAAVEVREGNNVTLTCVASGNPKPTIVWRRSDKQIIRYNGADGYGDSVHKGAELTLSRVSRRHMSEYLCVASNGIPPDESWSIKLHVLFEPIVIPQSMVAEAPLNALVVRIACTVEAWPRPNIVWMFGGQTLHDSSRYATEQSISDRYKSVHVLEIRNVQRDQFGVYKCLASNDYGSHFGEIRLIEVPPPDGRSLIVSLNEGSGANPDDEAGDAGGEGAEALEGWHWLPPSSSPPSVWLRNQLADKELRRSVSREVPTHFPDLLEPFNGDIPSLPPPNAPWTLFTSALSLLSLLTLLPFS